MFSDDEIKESESSFIRSGDEIISIRGVCLNDKIVKKDVTFQNEPFMSTSSRNYLDISRPLFRDGFFPDGLEQQQAKFAWTEEDGNIASLVSEPGFGTTGQTTFGRDLDVAFKSELKEADTSSSVLQPTNRNGLTFTKKPFPESQLVSSTSSGLSGINLARPKTGPGTCKVDKTDPRSRYHYVKYVKRQGKTIKLWECGICSREFQHQYTLLRHLPTHTDERNFHCVACGKSFRQLSTLSQHRAIHSTERPYSCEVCNKTFNRVSTLISHRKTHSDVKPYRCHICAKGFHQKGNLRNHLFTHTNARPYRCNICMKGFNQQSNLVCHKNKAHPEGTCSGAERGKITPRAITATETQPDGTRSPEQCEVTSSMGPYLPNITPASWVPKVPDWAVATAYEQTDFAIEIEEFYGGSLSNGVVVDPIKTYHMGVALAMKQTPFALLKPEKGNPVLVKVVDTMLPGGKQVDNIQPQQDSGDAVQIKVPVVATVVPRIKPGGRLHLAVEEPHHAYHTALTAGVGPLKLEPCTSRELPGPSVPSMPRLEPRPVEICNNYDNELQTGPRIFSTRVMPSPPPSPPLDFIPLDLFEPMECISLGPQVTPVDNITKPPGSDDSDIFIGKFEESIPLSDSD
ncbi:hypothetical protein K1T71_011777 [Dendrolimus kikuchii]|uniref:Uncharacterized protein n=1 Tax=Dendrolimus kikuchii TaxID=765133 RepID=A0ACC1CM23_9NEOP|nr:hypothetical protein K1T71_011777 [Dendrolimus kikuchii]